MRSWRKHFIFILALIAAGGNGLPAVAQDVSSSGASLEVVGGGQGDSDTKPVPYGQLDMEISRKRSPWSYGYFNWATQNVKDSSDGSAQLSTYNFVSFDYRLSRLSKISLRPEFYLSSAGKNKYGETTQGSLDMGDVYLQYAHNDWGKLPGDISLLGVVRIYLPTSDFAKKEQQLTQLQARMIFNRDFGRGFEINYHLRPKYWIQSQVGYVNDYGSVSSTKHAEIEQLFEFVQEINRSLGIAQQIGVTTTSRYGVPTASLESRIDSKFELSSAVDFTLSRVNFRAGITNEIPLQRTERAFAIYRPEESSYFLMTYAPF